MSDNNEQQNGLDEDGVYVIDESEGSLEEFDPSTAGQPAAGQAPTSEDAAPAPGLDEAVQRETQSLRDQLLRARADFDNFRKRAEKEKADYKKYALAQTITELLPVVDNFERALQADASGSDFRTGVEMIYKQMTDVLRRLGLREVEAENAMFDPTMHEAVMSEETTAVPYHQILQVLQKGYFLNDRLIRPAMVKVAVGGPESQNGERA